MTMEDLKQQALTEHLRDLRDCLVVSLLAVLATSGLSYVYGKEIGDWFLRPLLKVLPAGSSLIFTSYTGGFFFI